MTEKVEAEPELPEAKRERPAPLIFISHDTRDAELAELFSKLLSSVSAGVLKSFRSSDKKGNQGIEYGVEWFPEIMKKLELASDVVCLLTPNSVGRPWILYEAGVAKGKLDTPVHGVAIGLPLQNASSGPFAQFQNSDDSEDALTQLVIQLVRRIPGADPDRDVVKLQVAAFREKALALSAKSEIAEAAEPETDGASVAKLFEEVKVMFKDLPARIERRVDPERTSRGRFRGSLPPPLWRDMLNTAIHEMPDGVALLIAANQLQEEFPWLSELARDAYRKISSRDSGAIEAMNALELCANVTMGHPLFRELAYRSRDKFIDPHEMVFMLLETTMRTREKMFGRQSKIVESTKVQDAQPGEVA